MTLTIPAPTARFRPRADADLLARLSLDARTAHAEALNAEIESGVRETITAWLENRHPADDMAVLARWGYAKDVESINVWAHGEIFGLKLTRTLRLPENCRSVTACARRYSEEPDYGLKPDYLARLKAEGGLDAYLADHRAREAQLAPRSIDALFTRLVDARRAFEAIRLSLTNFAQAKDAAGRYPTWGDIEAAFPVIGDYIAARRAEG